MNTKRLTCTCICLSYAGHRSLLENFHRISCCLQLYKQGCPKQVCFHSRTNAIPVHNRPQGATVGTSTKPPSRLSLILVMWSAMYFKSLRKASMVFNTSSSILVILPEISLMWSCKTSMAWNMCGASSPPELGGASASSADATSVVATCALASRGPAASSRCCSRYCA